MSAANATVRVLCPSCEGERDDDLRRSPYEDIYDCETCCDKRYVEMPAADCELRDLGDVTPAGRSLIYAVYAEEWGAADTIDGFCFYRTRCAAQGWRDSVAFWDEVEAEFVAIYGTGEAPTAARQARAESYAAVSP